MPLNTQGGYSFHMAVDPASPGDGINDIIYFGAVRQARSIDSGQTFVDLSGLLHADTHAWAFAPQPGSFSVVYCGNDGGLSGHRADRRRSDRQFHLPQCRRLVDRPILQP
jgi:hypothetical protein